MKRLRNLLTIIMLLICILIPNVTFAYSDYCYTSYDGQHDYYYCKTMALSHPHKGYFECFCGKQVHSNYLYDISCEICRRELCKKGVHYFLNEVHYTDYSNYSGYCKCYCGKTKEFFFEKEELEREPYFGFLTLGNMFFSAAHPHYEYNVNTGSFIIEDLEEPSSVLTDYGCGVCEIMSDYYIDFDQYEMETIIYNNTYDYYNEYEEDFYYEEEYDEYEFYEYEYEYDEYEEYLEYDEDEDFYSWLELVKDILN